MSKAYVKQLCAGVSSPREMGTTGLVAWVLAGERLDTRARNRWERFEAAKRIIKQRGLSVSLFVDAILATGRHNGINLQRLFAATRAECGKTTLRPELVTWTNETPYRRTKPQTQAEQIRPQAIDHPLHSL